MEPVAESGNESATGIVGTDDTQAASPAQTGEAREDEGEGQAAEAPQTASSPSGYFGATAAGARALMAQQGGAQAYRRLIHGPASMPDLEQEPELRTRADSSLLDVSLALNRWMPPVPVLADGEHLVPAKSSVLEIRAARREAAESERLEAAKDAVAFFEEQARTRAAAHTMNGLAHNDAVRHARTRPWDVWTRRELFNAGLDGGSAETERAVREWEPELFDDPIDSRHVASSWAAETDARVRELHSLVKEGWLWMPGLGRKWVMLRKNKGLLWSQAPRDSITGMVLFAFLTSLERARDDDCAFEFTRSRAGSRNAKVLLRADTPEEAHTWFLHIQAQIDLYKVMNGIGFLEPIVTVQPSQEFDIRLPAVDLNEERGLPRALIFHVVEGQMFQEGDLLCEIERVGGIKPNVDIYAKYAGKVVTVQKSRKEDKDNPHLSFFAVGDPILRLRSDPDWISGERFLPRREPTNEEKELQQQRRVVAGKQLEFVPHAMIDFTPPASRNRTADGQFANWVHGSAASSLAASRVHTSKSSLTARVSAGQDVPMHDLADVLVATAYENHADDFWMKNALLLESDRHDSVSPLLSTGPSRARATVASPQDEEPRATSGRNGTARNSTRTMTAETSWRWQQGSADLNGSAGQADQYGMQTIKSRYSSAALAAASKILLHR